MQDAYVCYFLAPILYVRIGGLCRKILIATMWR